jgi:hypothetical protein
MRDLSEKGRANLDSAAARQGIDPEAAFILLESLSKGGAIRPGSTIRPLAAWDNGHRVQ